MGAIDRRLRRYAENLVSLGWIGTADQPRLSARKAMANTLFGDIIREEIHQARLAADQDWWTKIEGAAATQDMSWVERETNLRDVLEAWAVNPFARRIVNLHTAHVIGRGMDIGSGRPPVDKWMRRWWAHRKNMFALEIYEWSDEVCRAGELFWVMFPNPHDGMQYVRAVPARRIVEIETDPDDYKMPLRYRELREGEVEGRWWLSPDHPDAVDDPNKAVMVHYAIHRPVGALRSWGGDLDTALPWLRRYTGWLKDRVAVNANRNAWVWDMQAASKSRLEELEEKYKAGLDTASLFLHLPNESLDTVGAKMDGADAEPDGIALRQVIGVGGNVPPHMLGDRMTTRSTGKEANAATYQTWNMRQRIVALMCTGLAQHAMRRAHLAGKFMRHLPKAEDWAWEYMMADLTREDNLALASAGKTIVDMMAVMLDLDLMDRETAIAWSAKFAGESVNVEDIIERIDNPPKRKEAIERHEQAVQAEELTWLLKR